MIITADQTAGNYWFRADAEPNCQSANNGQGRAIFTYQGVTSANPTTNPQANPPTACTNPQTTPKVALNAPSAGFQSQAQTLPVAFGPVVSNNQSLVLWTVNGTSMVIDPGKPTDLYVAEGNTSYPQSYNVVQISDSSTVRTSHFIHILVTTLGSLDLYGFLYSHVSHSTLLYSTLI